MAPFEGTASGISNNGRGISHLALDKLIAELAFVLFDVGVDDTADIVIFIFLVFQKAVILLLVVILDDDILDVVLVDHLHSGAFGLGLFGDFFVVLARCSNDERCLVGHGLDNFFGVLALLVLALRVFILGFGGNRLGGNRF